MTGAIKDAMQSVKRFVASTRKGSNGSLCRVLHRFAKKLFDKRKEKQMASNLTWGHASKLKELLEGAGIDGEILQKAFESGKFTLVTDAIKTVAGVSEQVFRVWKTIKFGTGLRTADEFRRALKSNGFRIGEWSNDILGRPVFVAAPKETEVDLVVVSVGELGFKNGASRREIYECAQELGLELCPAEVGPQLRLQYKDQPCGEWLLIGMEPIDDSHSNSNVFLVGHNDDGLWLEGHYGPAGFVWDGRDRWVFLRCK